MHEIVRNQSGTSRIYRSAARTTARDVHAMNLKCVFKRENRHLATKSLLSRLVAS